MCQHQGWGNHNGSFPKIYRKTCALDVPNCSQVGQEADSSSPPSSHSPAEPAKGVTDISPRSWSTTWVLCFLEASQAHWGHLAAWLDVCGRTVVGVGACMSNNHCISRASLWCWMQLIPCTAGSPTGLFGDSSHRAAEEKKKEIAFLFLFGKWEVGAGSRVDCWVLWTVLALSLCISPKLFSRSFKYI